eukprot:GHVT01088854.1.p2 GENE.GHVT01088854.1~~GHVT01088854.1.p2  ORF type:complete len:136 (-),score=6.26 GHVT01088854.1:29-436(-)
MQGLRQGTRPLLSDVAVHLRPPQLLGGSRIPKELQQTLLEESSTIRYLRQMRIDLEALWMTKCIKLMYSMTPARSRGFFIADDHLSRVTERPAGRRHLAIRQITIFLQPAKAHKVKTAVGLLGMRLYIAFTKQII